MMVVDVVQSRKIKAVCVQAMKVYKGSGSRATDSQPRHQMEVSESWFNCYKPNERTYSHQ